MSDLYDLFQKIKEKPPLYLGRRSIFQLLAFYYGYTHSRQEMGLEPTPEEIDFTNFHDWLQERLDARTTMSWASLILFRSVDERDALDRFFELLEKFKKRNDTEDLGQEKEPNRRESYALESKVMEKIRETLDDPRKEIHFTDYLVQDLKIDSDELCADFVLGIEEELGIEVPVEEWNKISTVQDVINLLRKYQKLIDNIGSEP